MRTSISARQVHWRLRMHDWVESTMRVLRPGSKLKARSVLVPVERRRVRIRALRRVDPVSLAVALWFVLMGVAAHMILTALRAAL
jgi:hypothetical protein